MKLSPFALIEFFVTVIALAWINNLIPALPANTAAAVPTLQSEELNTKPFPCDGKLREVGSTSGAMQLRKLYIWTGLDMGARADLVVQVVKKPVANDDGGNYVTIAKAGVDRYAEPTSLQGQTLTFDFSPDHFAIGKDEEARLFTQCNNWGAPTRAHVIAILYYLKP